MQIVFLLTISHEINTAIANAHKITVNLILRKTMVIIFFSLLILNGGSDTKGVDVVVDTIRFMFWGKNIQ